MELNLFIIFHELAAHLSNEITFALCILIVLPISIHIITFSIGEHIQQIFIMRVPNAGRTGHSSSFNHH